MVSSTRARIALAALLGIFMIPLLTSSLNGLTHVLTCQAETASAFTVVANENRPPVILSSVVEVRGQDTSLCGGLSLDLGVGPAEPDSVRITVPITNRTRYAWKGSVKLVLDGTSVPLSVGEVLPGQTVTASTLVAVKPGSHQIDGTLLIGP